MTEMGRNKKEINKLRSVFYSISGPLGALVIFFISFILNLKGVYTPNALGGFAMAIAYSVLVGNLTTGVISFIISSSYYIFILFIYQPNSHNVSSIYSMIIIRELMFLIVMFTANHIKKMLTNKEIKYRELFDNTNDALLLHKTDKDGIMGNFIEVNDAACKLLGYSKEEFSNMTPIDLNENKEINKDSPIYKVLINEGRGFIERNLIKIDGKKIPVEVNLDYLNLDGENVVLSTVRDITERKKYEIALRESEERYKKLIKFLPDAVLVYNNGKITFSNSKAAKLFGVSSYKELNGKSVFDFVNPKSHESVKKIISKIENNNEEVIMIEEEFVGLKGGEVHTEIKATSIEYEGKDSILVVIRDVSKEKKAIRRIKKEQETYKKFFEILPDTIFMHDGERIHFTNEAGVKLLGLNDWEEIRGTLITDIVHKDYHSLVNENIKKVEAEGISDDSVEQEFIRKDKSLVPVEVRGASFTQFNKNYMIAVARDITQRKRAEELERRVEVNKRLLDEAKEYDRLKTEFFGNISHELRTPLNIILGTIQILNIYLQSVEDVEIKEKTNKRIKVMKQNCYRLMRLVNNLIDINKIDVGYFKLELVNVNIVSIVENITTSVAEYIENKGVKLIFDTEIEELITACDPDKIERIMLNLLSNAIKFTSPGDLIKVRVSREKDNIVISVKDTGIGIPKDKLEIIFQRFFQVDRSLKRNHEGSGIGLSLVKALVELHGGNIYINSEYGVGSNFIVNIPVHSVTMEDEEFNYEDIKDTHIERIHIEFSDIYS